MNPFRIFIGWDAREAVAWHVLAHSILTRATRPVALIPLVKSTLPYTRERGPLESTDFSLTRFLVPYLCGYVGPALFMDCDMLVRDDISQLEFLAQGHVRESPDKAVWVAQHDYTPSSAIKFLHQPQSVYPRKNWSSFMLFNTERCRALTPEYVNAAPALDLHRFAWIKDEQIGSLPLHWNWLVGEYAHDTNAKVYHYTLGGPWFADAPRTQADDEWLEEFWNMKRAAKA